MMAVRRQAATSRDSGASQRRQQNLPIPRCFNSFQSSCRALSRRSKIQYDLLIETLLEYISRADNAILYLQNTLIPVPSIFRIIVEA